MVTTFQLLSEDFQENPFPFYARMRQEGLSRLEPGGFWVVSRYADVAAALRNPVLFSSAGFSTAWEPDWLGPNQCAHSMHSMDPPDHTKMRNLVSTAFMPQVVERITPLVNALTKSAVDGFVKRGDVDIMNDVALPVTAGTIGHFLRLDPALHSKFKGWSDAMFSIKPVPKSPEHARHVRQSIDEMAMYMRSLIDERRRESGDDLVSLLVRAEVDGQRLSDKDLVPFLVLLLVGGLETTANLVGKAAHFLAGRTDVMDRLRADPSLVPRFVDEMLRYDPPVHSLLRTVKADTEVAGQMVPAGAKALLVLAAANRDVRQFPNPEDFDIDRDARGTLSFGHGPHFCIGMALGKLEGRLLLGELVTRFQRFEVLEPKVVWNQTYVVRNLTTLALRGVPA